jgi:drug/metabolite transporter (DMT)-like permease
VNTKALLTLLTLGGVWGASFLFIKVIVDETSPLEMAEGRLLLGAIAIGALMAVRRTRLPARPSLWLPIAAWSAIGVAIPFTLIGWAEEHIESGTASVLNSSMPLFAALFAAVFLLEERFTAARGAGLALGLLGVAVLTGGDVTDFSGSALLGQLAMIAAAACYGGAVVYARFLLRQDDPLGLSGAQLAVGALLLLPVMFATRGLPDYSLSVEAWLSLLALGVAGTGIGVAMYMWLVDNVGSVRSSLVTYVVPVVGLFLGWAVLDESIGLNTVLGFLLIVAGVASVMRGQAPSSQRLPLATEAAPAD